MDSQSTDNPDSDGELLSPSSQLGRLQQTGGTPEAGVQLGDEPEWVDDDTPATSNDSSDGGPT